MPQLEDIVDDPNVDDDELDAGENVGQQKKEPTFPPQDDLKIAMAELAGTVKKLAEPKEAAPAELTQEQKNELWAVYDPKKDKPDFMRKFFRLNPDATDEEVSEAEALFKSMHSGLMKQAMTGARNLMQIEMSKRDEKLARLEEYVSKQNAEQTKTRFKDAYPVFNDPKYGKILAASAKSVEGGEYKNESEFFQAVAEAAAETIKAVLPDFDLGATKPNKSAGTSPRLPRTSVGGTGGTGGGKQAALSVKGDATDDFLQDD